MVRWWNRLWFPLNVVLLRLGWPRHRLRRGWRPLGNVLLEVGIEVDLGYDLTAAAGVATVVIASGGIGFGFDRFDRQIERRFSLGCARGRRDRGR